MDCIWLVGHTFDTPAVQHFANIFLYVHVEHAWDCPSQGTLMSRCRHVHIFRITVKPRQLSEGCYDWQPSQSFFPREKVKLIYVYTVCRYAHSVETIFLFHF